MTVESPELKIRIGIGLGVQELVRNRSEMLAVCQGAEEEGFDSLWFSEVAASHALDPVAALGFVAAVTERIKMGTSVLVVPGRPPALLAKALATLDLLSQGRTLPIVGLGTVHVDEQQAFAVDRAERARWVDEAVPLLRRLWTEEAVTHRGQRFQLDGVNIHPKPRRSLPIWFGGRDKGELKRAGRLGDGWLASFATPAEVSAGIEVVGTAAARHGRAIDVDHYGVLMLYSLEEPSRRTQEFLAWRRPDLALGDVLPIGAAALCRRLREYIDAGGSKFILIPAERPADWRAELGALADAVLQLQTRAPDDPVRAAARR
jgi:probable F420-dependent oxidoreductase